MTKLKNKVNAFIVSESGATSVEYAIMLALIAGVCIAAIVAAGGAAEGFWNGNVDRLDSAIK